MKKFLFVLLTSIAIVACTGSNKDKQADEETSKDIQDKGLVTYEFKINGLQDSVVSDSIWRIIFQVEGIDQLVLSRDDSMAIFKVDPELVSNEMLQKEIVSRGGELLN